jgi:hypothetical protein
MPSSKRVSRIRAIALAMLLVGAVVTFLVGTMFPAQVSTTVGSTVKVTDYTKSPASGETAFNWLLALLVMGPALIASALLYSAAEIAAAVRRGGRSRSHERFDAEVGDEL